MPKDPRNRNAKHLGNAKEPQHIEWASPKQAEVFSYGPAPQCASGGYGSSKTYAFCMKIMYLSQTFPNNRGFVARRVWSELQKTTMSTFFKICPAEAYSNGGRRSDTEKILKFNNGSEVLWLHLDDPDTENILRGLEVNWFFMDQAEEIAEEIFDVALGRLGRWDCAEVPDSVIEQYGGLSKWAWKNPQGKPIVPTYPMLACNPDTEFHWIYRRFHENSPDHWEKKHYSADGSVKSYHDLGYKIWHMSSRENKFLPIQNLNAMLQQDESFVRRFVDGEWGIPEGQIHTFDETSFINGTPDIIEWLRQTCTLHRTLDHGDAAPTSCLWWAVDQSGNAFCYREYYVPNKLISDHRKEIAALSQNERYQLSLADPSIFMLTMQKYGGRWSVNDEYCLDRLTWILTNELQHKLLCDLKVGDKIAGFDEGLTSTRFRDRERLKKERRWRTAIVEDLTRITRPSYQLDFSDGRSVICSAEHKWLANPTGAWRLWRTTEQLEVGQSIYRATNTWCSGDDYESGYLASALDGEGFLTLNDNARRIGFSQRNNPMLSEVVRILDDNGVKYSKSKGKGTNGEITNIVIGRNEMLNVLGTARPKRLLSKFDFDKMGRLHVIGKSVIVKKTFLGDRELIGLKTSTRTCIANGLMSHNSDCKNISRDTALFWKPADNNELGTRNRINEYLRVDPDRVHPITKEKGSPRLFFIKRTPEYPNGCYNVIKESRAQRRLKIGSEAGKPVFSDERDDTISDHAYDCLRYFLASRPAIAPTAVANINPRSFNAVRQSYLKFKRKGGFEAMANKRRQEQKNVG